MRVMRKDRNKKIGIETFQIGWAGEKNEILKNSKWLKAMRKDMEMCGVRK